jgi:hypothetical protein
MLGKSEQGGDDRKSEQEREEEGEERYAMTGEIRGEEERTGRRENKGERVNREE